MRLFAGGFADQIGELLAGEFAESLAAFRELFVEFDGGLSHLLMGFLGAAELKSIFAIPGNHAII